MASLAMSCSVQDLTPLEIVLDKEAWMDEIPEEDMLGPEALWTKGI